jgi:ABC-type Fe3+/spermidine/putrescine transport system ATPase subunit
MNNAHLEVRGLNFNVGTLSLRDVHFCCRRGEYHILLGPSGSGKSTLMKCILGLLHPQSGIVTLNGRDITKEPPERRHMGYLPQDYALFPHLNVEENIRFGLYSSKQRGAEGNELVERLCAVLKISALRRRGVRNLSGGERQKVALGRALATQPEIVILDEPFSCIDEGARRMLWFELKRVVQEVGITAVHITHNLEEAYTLGGKLSILIDGGLVQTGTGVEIFEHPATESVARYLDYRNIFTGTSRHNAGGTSIDAGHFKMIVKDKLPEGKQTTVCVRPQDIKVIREDFAIRDSLKQNVFRGEVVSLYQLPEHCIMLFKIDGSPDSHDFELKFPAYIRRRHNLFAGKGIRVAIWKPNIIVFNG